MKTIPPRWQDPGARLGYKGYIGMLLILLHYPGLTPDGVATKTKKYVGRAMLPHGVRKILNQFRSVGLARREEVTQNGRVAYRYYLGHDESTSNQRGGRTRPKPLIISLATYIECIQVPRSATEVGLEMGVCADTSRVMMARLRRKVDGKPGLVRVVDWRPTGRGSCELLVQWDPGVPDAPRPSAEDRKKAALLRWKSKQPKTIRRKLFHLTTMREAGSVFGYAEQIKAEVKGVAHA